MGPSPEPGPPKTRRRGERLEHAIFDAVWDELAEVGYLKLTMEGVAQRAGTSKPVIYRRWSSRLDLVLATMEHKLPVGEDIPDTGELRSDLITLLLRLSTRYDRVPGGVFAGMMSETRRDPHLLERLRARVASGEQEKLLEDVLPRAVARGELDTAEIPVRVARLPVDLLRNESMIYRFPDERVITEIVDEVVLPLIRLHGTRVDSPRGDR